MNQNQTAATQQEKSKSQSVTLLFVDDESNILSSLKRLFRPHGYHILTAESGAEGLACLEKQKIDLVVSDMRMPEMDGAAFLEQVAKRWPETVRILLTGYSDLSATIAAVNKGRIYRYISKPWEDNDILLTVRNAIKQKMLELEQRRLQALIKKQNEELMSLNAGLEDKVAARTGELQQTVSFLELAHETLDKSYRTTVEVFSNLIEMREHRKSGGAREVADQCVHVAKALGMDVTDAQQLYYAALLRNIGKISLTDNLLKKSYSAMNDSEHKTFIQHPIIGEGVLMALEPLQLAARIIHSQHEHFNGTGFPDGLKGEAILLGARILKVIGDYNDLQNGLLLTTHMNQAQARDYLLQHRGSHYEPKVVDVYRALLGRLAQKELKVSEHAVKSNGLQSGMVLSRDLVLNEHVLLLSQGYCLTDGIIERIHSLEDSIDDDLQVYVLTDEGN